jgi:hypothetical protein
MKRWFLFSVLILFFGDFPELPNHTFRITTMVQLEEDAEFPDILVTPSDSSSSH